MLIVIPDDVTIFIRSDMGPYLQIRAIGTTVNESNDHMMKIPGMSVVKVVKDLVFMAPKDDEGCDLRRFAIPKSKYKKIFKKMKE